MTCALDLANSTGPVYTHLAVLDDDSERVALLPYREQTAEYWIGLSDLVTTDSWLWVTSQPTIYPPASGTPPWASGLPSGMAGARCVALDGDPTANNGLLFNDFCPNVREPYICECDGYPDDPTRY